MRKSVFLVLALLLIIGGFVFAQDNSKPSVSITAWGRGIFLPVVSAGGDAMSALGASWGNYGARVGYTVAGSTDNVGFQVDLTNDSNQTAKLKDSTGADVLDAAGNPYTVTIGAPGWGDQQKIWIKPISQIEFQMGRIYDDTLRVSGGGFGAWNWLRFSTMTSDDDIFARVGANQGWAPAGNEKNFELSVTPTDGLYAYAAFGGILATTTTVSDMFGSGQYGAGYTIQNIGTLSAQFIGDPTATYGVINAAFKLTAMPGLNVAIGGFIPTDNALAGFDMRFGLSASYALDVATVSLEANLMTAGSTTGLEGRLGVDYTIDKASNVGLNAEFIYQNADYSGFANGMVGFLLGVTKGFSNGVIGIGFEGTTGDFAGGYDTKAAADSFAWAIPIRMEYFF